MSWALTHECPHDISLKFTKACKWHEYECLHGLTSAFMANEHEFLHAHSYWVFFSVTASVLLFSFSLFSIVSDYATNFWNFCNSTHRLNTQCMLLLAAVVTTHFFFCSSNIHKQTWSCCICYFGEWKKIIKLTALSTATATNYN